MDKGLSNPSVRSPTKTVSRLALHSKAGVDELQGLLLHRFGARIRTDFADLSAEYHLARNPQLDNLLEPSMFWDL